MVDWKRPIPSVQRQMDRGTDLTFGRCNFETQSPRWTVLLHSAGSSSTTAVGTSGGGKERDDESASPPEVDVEMETELLGREEAAPPVANEHPPLDEKIQRREKASWLHSYESCCHVCVRARCRKNRHQQQQPRALDGALVIQ